MHLGTGHYEIFSHAYGCHSQFVNVQTVSHLYTSQDKEDRNVQQNYLYVSVCGETPPLEDEYHLLNVADSLSKQHPMVFPL